MKSTKKSRTSASASAPQLFAVDFNKEIGKLVAVTRGFWKMKNEDAKKSVSLSL
jgi:mRNA deadenylase 3'-5' endonuclease subunit Ccr4